MLIYARPCDVHSLEHPTAYSASQWCLEKVGLHKTYTHHPKGCLAVLWVDPELIGQIDIQLLKQDTKKDSGAVVDAYAFSNKVAMLSEKLGHLKCQNTLGAMVVKYEQRRTAWLELDEPKAVSSYFDRIGCSLADVSTDFETGETLDHTGQCEEYESEGTTEPQGGLNLSTHNVSSSVHGNGAHSLLVLGRCLGAAAVFC